MNTSALKTQKRERRHRRIRAKVKGTASMPRLSVFKSNKYIHVQLIDDDKGMTLAAISTKGMAGKGTVEKAKKSGMELAKLAKGKDISKVVFDRGGFIYTGQVKAVADGAREGGLVF